MRINRNNPPKCQGQGHEKKMTHEYKKRFRHWCGEGYLYLGWSRGQSGVVKKQNLIAIN